jgi:hypothetical protein
MRGSVAPSSPSTKGEWQVKAFWVSHFGMKRRYVLALPLSLLWPAPLRADNAYWTGRLLKGGFDGSDWWMGFAVKMQPGWKTYWRVPGSGGIAPDIKLTGENIKSFELLYPAPQAFAVELAGTVIGYQDEVIFPIRVTPKDENQPIDVGFDSFFGVCKEVCIPAQKAANLRFDPAEISTWRSRVPAFTKDGPVKRIVAEMKDGTPRILLDVAKPFPFRFVFVEGDPMHYFAGPKIMEGNVFFVVKGAKSLEELRLTELRITLDGKFGPLEQRLTVE